MQVPWFRFAIEGCRAGSNISKSQPTLSQEIAEEEMARERGERESTPGFLHFGNCPIAGQGQVNKEGSVSRKWDSTEWR